MPDLSVGEVSGLIAAGVFVLQVLLSLIFPAALIGFVGEENTVVTWSVLGRALQSSPWPSLLQTDTAARHGVQRRVSNALTLQTATVFLVSVAAIVTPLGLYQTVEPGSKEPESFRFLKDDSPFGLGTPDRIPGPFTRSCGLTDACPGSWKNETCVQQGLLQNCSDVVYGRSIPDIWMSAFRDGASQVAQSVSSIFDVQWRTQVKATDSLGDLGWYLKSGYRQVGILVLDPTIQLVDGLIVDAQTGGIGFRNHTVPDPTHEYGSTWSEDILFVEPEAQCVDLNVTFDFSLSQNNTSRLAPRDLSLTDHGGFSQLSRTSPNLSIPKDGNGQGLLDLKERAYKAAWANNFLTLVYFNKTDPDATNITRWDVTPGMAFYSSNSSDTIANDTANAGNFVVQYQAIRSSLYFGDYLMLPATPSSQNKSALTANPFGISIEDFDHVSEICAGGKSSTRLANINSSIVGCGLIYGAARRTDGGSELSPQPGSKWSVPVYSCAASVRATIRTVTFKNNGTTFSDFKVTSSTPKTYSSPPTWAVENMHSTTISTAQPLWGILSPNTSPLPQNISTTQQPSLRLPGLITAAGILSRGNDYILPTAGQNLPAVDFYVQALQNAFTISSPGTVGYEGYADYSGLTAGLALYGKWQNLSASADGAAQILKLVWTDIAANSVVGTKGWEGQGSGPVVTVFHRKVRYDLLYMVPAVVVAVLALVVVGTWVVLMVLGRTGPGKMRRLLDATSTGRVLGGVLWPTEAAAVRGTDGWVKTVGTRAVVVVEGSRGVVAAKGKGGQDEDVRGNLDGEELIQLMSKDKPAETAQ